MAQDDIFNKKSMFEIISVAPEPGQLSCSAKKKFSSKINSAEYFLASWGLVSLHFWVLLEKMFEK